MALPKLSPLLNANNFHPDEQFISFFILKNTSIIAGGLTTSEIYMSKDFRYIKKDKDVVHGDDMVRKSAESTSDLYEQKANDAKRSYLQRDRNHRRQCADLH